MWDAHSQFIVSINYGVIWKKVWWTEAAYAHPQILTSSKKNYQAQ